MDNEQAATLEPTWAVIELFGHSQIAGRLSTITLGGSCLLKVDVPETVRQEVSYGYGMRPDERYEVRTPAYARIFGVGAIYAINPCSEEIAVKMAQRITPGEVAQRTAIKTSLALPQATADAEAMHSENHNEPDQQSELGDEAEGDEL